jgi:hypothetical protein
MWGDTSSNAVEEPRSCALELQEARQAIDADRAAGYPISVRREIAKTCAGSQQGTHSAWALVGSMIVTVSRTITFCCRVLFRLPA